MGTHGEPQGELPRFAPLWGPDVVKQLGRQQKGTWSHSRPRTNIGRHVPKNAPMHLGNPGAAQLMTAHRETCGEEGHVRHRCTPQEERRLHVGSPHKDEMTREVHGSPQQSDAGESLSKQPLDVALARQRSPHAEWGGPECIVSQTRRNGRSTPYKETVQPKERREERSQER